LAHSKTTIFLTLNAAHTRVPFAANILPSPIQEPPEVHRCLDLAKGRFGSTLAPPIEFAMARLVRNPLEFPFGQVTLAHADHLTSIDGF